MKDLQADLTADLLADLDRPAPLPAPVPLPPLPGRADRRATPALAVTLTPLRWSRPRVRPAGRGTGLALVLGPWRVEVAF